MVLREKEDIAEKTESVTKVEKDIDALVDVQNTEMGHKWCCIMLVFVILLVVVW